MKMDIAPIRAAEHPRPSPEPTRPSVDPTGSIIGIVFLLLAPLLLVTFWAMLAVAVVLAAAWRLIRECLAYSAEVTVGRR